MKRSAILAVACVTFVVALGVTLTHAAAAEAKAPAPAPAAASTKPPTQRPTITINGALTNITRAVRDPATGQIRQVSPADIARIAVNGGANVFFSDVTGQFAVVLNVPDASAAATPAAALALYHLDVDWGTLAFPRVLVEVDAFGNFRAYLDGLGRIAASRGRMGVDAAAEAKRKSQQKAAVVDPAAATYEIEELDESGGGASSYDDSGSGGGDFLSIEAMGDMEYFMPRQEFRVTDLLKNPMMLMMIATAFLVYVMPKIVDQDELKTQMRDLQKMKDDGAAALTGGGGGGEAKKVKKN